jgi:hypothetical protein
VHLLIGGEVIGLLKKDIRSNPGILESPEFLNGQRRDLHIDTTNFSPTLSDIINGFNGIQNIIEAVFGIGLTGKEQDPFVSGSNKMAHLFRNFSLGKNPSSKALIAHAKGTVLTVVLAEV